jgi:hypothetical protein
MIRLLFILFLLSVLPGVARSQPITVDDLITVSTLSPKSIDHYMNKKGFLPGRRNLQDDAMIVSFFQKRSNKFQDSTDIIRTLDIYQKENTYCYALHTSSMNEYLQGRNLLKKSGFFYDKNKDSAGVVSLMFQNKNITVVMDSSVDDAGIQYTFLLQRKEWRRPTDIQYADELLQFDSHEYLASFFGESNVKKDVYYFSEKELKKCSILFPNSNRQAIFIWDDEANFRKLSYILISGISPTLNAAQYIGNISQNKWVLKNGIYSGMSLRELMQLNGGDFEFYGRDSEFSFLVAPKHTGEIDFKKTGIMLGCLNCTGAALLDKTTISAAEAVDKDLFLHIFYIMISP